MYRKLIALVAVLAVLFGAAYARDFSANIKLKLFDDSSKHWLAVDPVGDNDATVAVEMLESTSSDWAPMTHNAEAGYWQMWSSSPSGFALPVSFRLTAEDGEQVIMDNVMTSVAPGAELETAVQFARSARHNGGGHNNDDEDDDNNSGRHNGHGGHSGNGGNNDDSDNEDSSADSGANNGGSCPTARPTRPPTSAPTTAPTNAPTQRPTGRPTDAPTTRPTQRPTDAPTTRPTQRPTSAPTTRPTSAPTTRPTSSGSSSGSSNTDLCAVTSTSQEPVKILVPLYDEPGKDWDSLISSSNAGVSIIAIINPDNGPVTAGPPSNWRTYMGKMNDAKIDMVGYVATGYAKNSLSSMKSQIDVYASKYTGTKGIFLDEVSNLKGDIPYYQELHDYIMSKGGFVHNILNPGTSTDQGYLACSTNIVIYESQASSFRTPSASWVKCAPNSSSKAGYKYKFSGIAFSASQSTMSSLVSQMANAGMGMVYITDKSLPNPYAPIPSYWSAFANAVKAL